MFIIREKRRENCQKSKMKPRIGTVFQINFKSTIYNQRKEHL